MEKLLYCKISGVDSKNKLKMSEAVETEYNIKTEADENDIGILYLYVQLDQQPYIVVFN